MACEVIFEMRVKPECMSQLISWMSSTLEASRNYEGCSNLSVAQNQDDANEIIIIQRWETREHYEKFLTWRKETGVFGTLVAMADKEPRLRFFDYFDV